MRSNRPLSEIAGLRHPPRGLPPNALGEMIEATLQKRFMVMGHPVLIQTNEPLLMEAAEEGLGRYPQEPDPVGSPLVVRLLVHERRSPGAPLTAGGLPRQNFRTQGHLYYHTIGDESAVVGDLAQGYACGFVTPELAAIRSIARLDLIQGTVMILLAGTRRFLGLHAACVAKGDTSILISGGAGAGKSTTAYACVRRGYRLISEDGLNLSADAEGCQLWGTPWVLHLLPDTLRFFPELADEVPQLQLNGERKLEIDVDRYYPGASLTHVAPGLVVFLEPNGHSGAPDIAPVSREEALAALGIVWPWHFDWSDEVEDALLRLLDGKAYRVVVNGDPDAVVDVLDGLVAETEKASVPWQGAEAL